MPILILLLAGLFAAAETRGQSPVASGTVITIAGNGTRGFSGDGGPATNAALTEVEAMTVGPDGTLYLVDSGNYRIRAIDPATGHIQTLAGNGEAGSTGNGGPATNASLSTITSLATDRSRNVLYLSDVNHNVVRRIHLADGTISIYAGTGILGFTGDGGPATAARLRRPWGLATDAVGRLSLAAQFRVRQVNPVTGIITSIAGGETSDFSPDGFPALSTSFHGITELAADAAGNVFIFEGFSNEPRFVRRVDVVSGLVSTVAGGGTNAPTTGVATNMQFVDMFDIAVSSAGELFIAMNFELFRVDLATGGIAPIAGDGIQGYGGDGGPALSARFDGLSALASIPGGGVVVADMSNYRLRYIAPHSIRLTNDSGQTSFRLPWLSSLTGDFILVNNPNLTNVNASSITNVTGVVNISGNTSADVISLSELGTVAGEVNIADNTNATVIDLSSLESAAAVEISGNTAADVIALSELGTVASEVNIADNTSADVIDLSSLESAGSVEISGNTAADVIALSELDAVAGEVNIAGNTSADVIELNSLESAGSVEITGNTAAAVIALGELGSVAGEVNIAGNTNASVIDLTSLSNASGDVTIESNSTEVVVNMGSLTNYGCSTNEITLTLDGGIIEMTNGLTLCTNATLTGSTTVDGSITNNGTIEPGSSPGWLNITGNLHLNTASRLNLEIGGYASNAFDVVGVAGNVILGGTLAVRLLNSFTNGMTNGASFTVLTAGPPLAGSFSNVASGDTLVTADGRARFTVRYAGENSVRLTDLEILNVGSGDTDGDGLPDSWEDQFGLDRNVAGDALLDLDGDGFLNRSEFLAGTHPNDPSSVFRILSFTRETNTVEISWSTVGGKSYRVQTNAASDGNLTNNFVDFSPLIPAPGLGEAATNFIDTLPDSRARYYRVRIAP